MNPSHQNETIATRPGGALGGPIAVVIAILLVGWFLVIAISFVSRNPLGVTGGGFAAESGEWRFPIETVAAMLGLIATILGAGALGMRLLELLPDPPDWTRAERILFGLLFGLSALGLGIFFLGLFPAYYQDVFRALLILFLAHAVYCFLKRRSHSPQDSARARLTPAAWAILILVGVTLALTLLASLSPPVQSDGLRYHLAGPQEYLKAHRLSYLPHQAFTNFPFLMEMLFLWGLGLGSDLLAQSLHWVFLPISAGLLWTFYSRFLARTEQPNTTASLLAPAILVTTPCVAIAASWPFNDLAVLACFLALIYGVTGYIIEGRRGWIWLAGIAGGFALGMKYTLVVFVLLAGVVILLGALLSRKESFAQRFIHGLREALLLGAIAAVIGCPWYVKNLINTGNPVYPLAYSVFAGSDWSAENAAFYSAKAAEKGIHTDAETGRLRAGKATSFADCFALAWRFTYNWPLFEAHIPGFVYVFLFPMIAAYSLWVIVRVIRKGRPRDSALVVVLMFAWAYQFFWVMSYQSNRFLIPDFALYGLLAAAMCADLRAKWTLAAQTLLALILVASIYGTLWTGRWLIFESKPNPLSPALGFVQRDIYLGRALNYYPAAAWLNENARPGESVLMVGEHRGYYFHAPYLLSDWFDTPRILAMLRETPDNDALLSRLYNEEGVRYVFFNGAELSLYFDEYFRPRFSDEEFRRFKEFVADPRLQQVRTFGDPRIYVARLLPPGT